jgi:hypothetical protein
MSPLHFIEPTTKREKGDTNEGLSSFENRYSVNCPLKSVLKIEGVVLQMIQRVRAGRDRAGACGAGRTGRRRDRVGASWVCGARAPRDRADPRELSEGVVWRRSMRHIKGARREIWCVRLKSDDGNICDG